MNPDLWSGRPWLTLLSWLPVPLGTLALWLPAWPAFARRLSRPWVSVLAFALTRVAFAWLVFGVLGHRSLDWSGFVLQAQAALEGRLPYRDFPTLFAPGLPYLFGVALALAPTWGLLTLFIACDLGAFLALARREGGAAPRPDAPAWAYLAFPPVWYFEIRYGQEETVAALCVALALLAFARGRALWAGVALAAGQLTTKLLFGLAAFPLLVAPRATLAARAAYLVPVAGVYLAMTVAGLPWLAALGVQAGEFGSGPTLWRLPQLWLSFELGRLAMLPYALVLAIGWWRLIRRGAGGITLLAWCWGCFALLAPKLLPMYVVMVAPALAVWVTREPGRGRFAWWGLYGFAFATAWYADSGPVQGLLGPVGVVLGAAGVLLPVALDLWLLREVWRRG